MQVLLDLQVPDGTTPRQLLAMPEAIAVLPPGAASGATFGVFGRRIDPDRSLRDRDRLELYRPLLADPKESRRVRAQGFRKGPLNR